jgi:hypothetical protein
VDEMIAQGKQMKEKTGKPYIIRATFGAGDFANGARGYYSWLYDQNGSRFPNGYEKANLKTSESLAKTRKAVLIFLKFLWDHNFDWARGGGYLPARQSLMAEYAKLPLRQCVVDIPTFGRALSHTVRLEFGFQNMIGEEITNIINTGKTEPAPAQSWRVLLRSNRHAHSSRAAGP